MDITDFKSFIEEINRIIDNSFSLKTRALSLKGNEFLFKIKTSDNFKQLTLRKIERLFNTYKDTDYKNIIIEDIEKLFYNTWDGAYSELTAYDMLNLAFDTPCEIQITDIKKKNTLAKYCYNADVSAIDGYLRDAFMFFEVKTLQSRFSMQMNKIKQELECYKDEEYFTIESDYPLSLEIKNDKDYAALKKEILEAKGKKLKSLNSKIVKNLFLKLNYERKPVTIEFHNCENSYEMAKRLERLPLEDYKQFVDGMFSKIFVCNGLNMNNHIACSEKFFRALARRVFCRLVKVKTVHDGTSDKSTSFIAKRLGGLMFIVDLSANTNEFIENPRDLYKVYFYTNPNAVKRNKLFDIHHIYSYLNRIKTCECDDFVADNY